ncbi:hypothetical protein FRC08_010769 [Ceratobasidium sp. 394]|nr:hypothetical protein FRC08_010769 [Ceratobasidium sp. 394]
MGDWNFGKMISMGAFLASKYKDTLRAYKKQQAAFLDIDTCISESQKQIWSAMSLKAEQTSRGVWTSVFSTPSSKGKLQALALANQKDESGSAHTPAKKPGVTQWLIMGIELENEQNRLREERSKMDANSTLHQREVFDAKSKTLNERIVLFREGRRKYMGEYDEPDHQDRRVSKSANPEDAELGLPSSYLAETIDWAGLRPLASLEGSIWWAECSDALDCTRDLLGARALTLKFKKANIRGEIRTTRAEAAIRAHTERIHQAQWRYNNSRDGIIRLGASKEDLTIYRRLEKSDLKYLKEFSEHDSRAVGQGHVTISWIWTGRDEAYKDEDTWLAQTMKVEWFRARERFKRWEEELKLLKREMVMSYRGFKTREEIWMFKAETAAASTSSVAGMAEYARARGHFFRQLADGVLQVCLSHMQDNTVSMRWCDEWLSRAQLQATHSDEMEIWLVQYPGRA